MFKDYINKNGLEIVREVIISILFAAIVSGLFSLYIDKKSDERIASREFLQKFREAFSDNPKYRNISIAIEEQYLSGKGKLLKENGGQFTDYELDDYLGLLYEIYTYANDGYVKKYLLDQNFSYYICITQQNKEVQDYQEKMKKEGFGGDYFFLEEIAEYANVLEKNCKEN